jgi:large subunit ribosomal protein L22
MITRARLTDFGVGFLKVRRFASTIKGEPVDRAIAILDMQSSPTCQTLHKLLRSAVANAENNNQIAPENLIVSNVMIDQGPTTKRIRPRARGRAYRILKRSCHVTIELDLKKGLSVEALREEQSSKGRAKRTGKAEQKPASPKAGAPAKKAEKAKAKE